MDLLLCIKPSSFQPFQTNLFLTNRNQRGRAVHFHSTNVRQPVFLFEICLVTENLLQNISRYSSNLFLFFWNLFLLLGFWNPNQRRIPQLKICQKQCLCTFLNCFLSFFCFLCGLSGFLGLVGRYQNAIIFTSKVKFLPDDLLTFWNHMMSSKCIVFLAHVEIVSTPYYTMFREEKAGTEKNLVEPTVEAQ